MGWLVRKAMLITATPNHDLGDDEGTMYSGDPLTLDKICEGKRCHCASACVLIWAAGIERLGGVVGLHRPSLRSTSFANLPPERASGLYRLLIAEIDGYLTEMEVPRRFIELMTGTSSNDIRWLTIPESNSLEEVPSIAEWIAASCGVNSVDASIRELLAGRNDLRKLSPRERAQWEMFVNRSSDKDSELWGCKYKKIDNSRDAIAID